ncbi:hypothetical protein Hanom_Chr06g00494791 [Helianthus anomalus]
MELWLDEEMEFAAVVFGSGFLGLGLPVEEEAKICTRCTKYVESLHKFVSNTYNLLNRVYQRFRLFIETVLCL